MRLAGERRTTSDWHVFVSAASLLAAVCSSCASPPAPAPSTPSGSTPFQTLRSDAEPAQTAEAGWPAQSGHSDGQGAGQPAGKEAAEPDFIHGSISVRYRQQSQGSKGEQDLWALLDLEMGHADRDPWTATIVGRLADDLGHDSNEFKSPEDTFSSHLTSQLYEAHIDLHDVPSVELLALGRQELDATPAFVRFDGFQLETVPAGKGQQTYGFYGGQTVHFWESSSQGDVVFGGWWTDQPWAHGQARLDWMHIEDESVTGSQDDDLLAAKLQQRVSRSTQLQGDYSWLGGVARDRRLAATWNDGEQGTLVKGTWYELLSTQFDLTEELDPFSPLLFAQFPYREAQVVASKSWDEGFDLEGGADVRRVTDQSDVSDFNRDFERYHVTGTRHDTFVKDLSLGLTGEIWDSGGTSETSWGLDATREWDRLRMSLGTYYALFKDDFFSGDEHDSVRTWYAALRYLTESRTTWTLGYDFEDTSEGNFHTLRLGAIWRF